VHHKDHDPLNNVRENLELWSDNRSHKLAERGKIAVGIANRWRPWWLASRAESAARIPRRRFMERNGWMCDCLALYAGSSAVPPS
jgi:hypothetical protein